MKKLSILLAAVILAVAAIISGCGSSVGDEFVGTWERQVGTSKNIGYITIEKKGNKDFIFNVYVIDSKGNLSDSNPLPVELKDKALVTPEGRIIEIKDGILTYHNKEIKYHKIDNKILNLDELSNKIK